MLDGEHRCTRGRSFTFLYGVGRDSRDPACPACQGKPGAPISRTPRCGQRKMLEDLADPTKIGDF